MPPLLAPWCLSVARHLLNNTAANITEIEGGEPGVVLRHSRDMRWSYIVRAAPHPPHSIWGYSTIYETPCFSLLSLISWLHFRVLVSSTVHFLPLRSLVTLETDSPPANAAMRDRRAANAFLYTFEEFSSEKMPLCFKPAVDTKNDSCVIQCDFLKVYYHVTCLSATFEVLFWRIHPCCQLGNCTSRKPTSPIIVPVFRALRRSFVGFICSS